MRETGRGHKKCTSSIAGIPEIKRPREAKIGRTTHTARKDKAQRAKIGTFYRMKTV